MKSTFRFMRGNVLTLTIARLISWFPSRTFISYFSLYVYALGGTAKNLGFVAALGWIARLFLYPIGGYMADYRGRVKLISVARYLSALLGLFYVFAQDWTMLAAGTFFEGLILFSSPALAALKADSLPPQQRATGFATINAIPGIIAIIAPYIGGHLITTYGITIAMRYLYAVNVICNIAVGTIYLKFLKAPLKESKSRVSLRNFPSLLKTSYKSLWNALKGSTKELKSLAFIATLIAFFDSICGAFWIVYVVDVIKLTLLEWGLIMVVINGLSNVLRMPAGMLIDRYGKKWSIMVALILSIPPALFFVYCKTFLHVLAIFILIGVANIFLLPAGAALIADLVPRGRRGRFMAAFGEHALLITTSAKGPSKGFMLDITSMLGSLAGGYIYSFNHLYPWFLVSAALILCLILTIVLIHEPKEPQL